MTAILQRFFNVRGEELAPILTAALFFFFVLTSLMVMRPARDAIGMEGGLDSVRWLFIGTALVTLADVKKTRIAVPGTLTTAYLTLKLFAPEIETVVVPFDKIIPAVVSGEYDAGLIIHEGQLTYANDGLIKLLDLGQWWREQTGLPLPLGGNAIRRSLGAETLLTTTNALRDIETSRARESADQGELML